MIDTKELRRLAQAAAPGPDGVSLSWVKLLQDFQKGANPATITELLDRLEAAESDALEQARLNGMGASREAALMAKLEAAEKSDAESIAMYRKARDERAALQAKVEAMEKQEPTELRFPQALRKMWAGYEVQYWLDSQGQLYALPGAQPAPSALDARLRSRVADLLHLLQFAQIACPTAGDSEQAESVMADLKRTLEQEAKPCP